MIDLHNDAIICLSPKRFSKYIKRARKAGVETILISVWTTEMQDPLQEIRKYKKMLSEGLLLHIEDAWFVTEDNIEELIELQPFSVGLTWNKNNALAGGAYDDGGLTELGKFVVDKLIAAGIYIDLAHLNRRSFFEVPQKLLCTHTCFAEVHQHPRNLDREQIQAIVDAGGIIGLTLVNEFLGGQGIHAHIKYFRDNFGEGNLAIGTDFFGTTDLPKGLRNYRSLKRHINKYDFQRTIK